MLSPVIIPLILLPLLLLLWIFAFIDRTEVANQFFGGTFGGDSFEIPFKLDYYDFTVNSPEVALGYWSYKNRRIGGFLK